MTITDRLASLLILFFSGRPDAAGESEYGSRLYMIAAAQVEACKAQPIPGWPLRECVALGATMMVQESGLRRDVHSGERFGPGAAKCLYQIQPDVSEVPFAEWRVTLDDWYHSTGLGRVATLRCTTAGTKILGYHAHRCGVRPDSKLGPERMFQEYHMPTALCDGPISDGARYRAKLYRGNLERLRTVVDSDLGIEEL